MRVDEKPIEKLLSLMRTLRSEGGCPWDREQTLETLKPFLVEEAYEVLDAIDSQDRQALKEELGDVLLQVVFQSRLCEEEGSFTFDDVARTIGDKLVRRHPHVFGDTAVSGSDEVLKNWNAIKRDEKSEEERSAVGSLPRHLPALQKADQIQKRVAQVGFDWDELAGVIDKIEEELEEVKAVIASGGQDERVREEIGDLLFSTVNLSRYLGHNPEAVLNETIEKFIRRFKAVEKELHSQGREMTDCDLADLDIIWNQVKKREKAPRDAADFS